MTGLDTNVLARYFVAEQPADPATEAQRQAARQLIESGQPLFLPKTVALELEWVLRGYRLALSRCTRARSVSFSRASGSAATQFRSGRPQIPSWPPLDSGSNADRFRIGRC
jgi:hypothetical protein